MKIQTVTVEYAPWVAIHGLTAPYGQCQCGCGQDTSIATKNHTGTGMLKNHPRRYFPGHTSTTHNEGGFIPWAQKYGLAAPYGECQCGCGRATLIAPKTYAVRGEKEGQPRRYLRGHNMPKPTGDGPNPSGLCMCGCGRPAPIAKSTSQRYGHVQGRPTRFIRGHWDNIQPTRPLADRFWEKVAKGAPDECWPFMAAKNQDGYGNIYHEGRMQNANRIAWVLTYGPIPAGQNALHRCDNPPCCNPNHLFLGTQADNIADMIAKGRQKVGQS